MFMFPLKNLACKGLSFITIPNCTRAMLILAGFVLADRSWQGLEAKLGQTPVEKAKEGRRGIAMGYTDEPNQES